MYFDETHNSLRDLVKKFVDKEINPFMDEWEKMTVPLHDLFKKMGELGLLGIRYDPKYGGQGLDYWYETVFLEELGHVHGYGVPQAITVHTNMATPAIAEFGSEYLKKTYLKPAIEGKMVSAIAVTEPGAGSDVVALRTKAVRDGDCFVINGSKLFITNGYQADFLTLLARTSDKPGYHSYGLLVVPTNLRGVAISKLEKLGTTSSDVTEIFLEDVRVPAENLIGEEREGFIHQMKQFQHERFTLLPIVHVMSKDIIDMTVEYIKQRVAFGKPLIANQVLRHKLVEWLTEIECLKQLTYHIVRMRMEGFDAKREISMGKVFAAKVIKNVADGCLQMFGGIGYMNETLISRYYRDACLFSIGGGANEAMSDYIAKMEGY